jgi:hypothetical protein
MLNLLSTSLRISSLWRVCFCFPAREAGRPYKYAGTIVLGVFRLIFVYKCLVSFFQVSMHNNSSYHFIAWFLVYRYRVITEYFCNLYYKYMKCLRLAYPAKAWVKTNGLLYGFVKTVEDYVGVCWIGIGILTLQ